MNLRNLELSGLDQKISGSIGFLVYLTYSLHYVKMLDTSLEGKIVLPLYHTKTGICIIVVGVYILLSSRHYGHDSESGLIN